MKNNRDKTRWTWQARRLSDPGGRWVTIHAARDPRLVLEERDGWEYRRLARPERGSHV